MLEIRIQIILLFLIRLFQRRPRFTIPILFLTADRALVIWLRWWCDFFSRIQIDCLIWSIVPSLTLSSLRKGVLPQIFHIVKIWKFIDEWFGVHNCKVVEVMLWLSGRANIPNNWGIMLNVNWGWCRAGQPVVEAVKLLSLPTLPISGTLGSLRILLVWASNALSSRKDWAYGLRADASENPLLAFEFFVLFPAKVPKDLSLHRRLVITRLSRHGSLPLIEILLNYIYFFNHCI